KNAAALRRKLAPFSSTMPARRDEEHAAGPADSVKRGAQHGHPGVGERPGHRGQRARAHPRERGCAVRSRDQTTLTGAGPSGAMASFSNVADRPGLAQVSAYREPYQIRFAPVGGEPSLPAGAHEDGAVPITGTD